MKKLWIVWIALLTMSVAAFAVETTTEALNNPDRGVNTLDAPGDVVAVIGVPVPSLSGIGVSIAADCAGNLYYTNHQTPTLHKMTGAGALINSTPLTVIWTKDAFNDSVTALEVDSGTCVGTQLPDTCEFPYNDVDMGDLQACNYPTMVNNPAHALTDIAWLGAGITGEAAPNSVDNDPMDDGVVYMALPWTPCTPQVVQVTVTPGTNYGIYAVECGGHLYLNGCKDGNLDLDFCDELCPDPAGLPTASEWIVQDMLVTPGVHTITVMDPGVFDLGVYDGVFRWRLTSQPVGRFGFGLAVAGACQNQCGTFAFDFLGEVEDDIVREAQLAVELSDFTALAGDGRVTLNWTTASETDNNHF